MPLGQTITIVNKSGKIVSTSKHLVNVFNEAKSAYSERKAELRAQRRSEQNARESQLQQQFEVLAVHDDDAVSRHSSRRASESGRSVKKRHAESRASRRPPAERGFSDSLYENEVSHGRTRRSSHHPSPLGRDDGLIYSNEPRVGELTRRNTDGMQLRHHESHAPGRSASADDIDMDLAYGDLPPPLPERKLNNEIELRSKMNGLQRMLDEANCVHHTVTATIDNLQKNPDALAAVALTLGEIANLATKMAPGALTALKGSFPAIIALLASPQFAIAAGVGVGVTIIALGGYKIIKKITEKKTEERLLEDGNVIYDEPEPEATPVSEYDELREIDRIELWRRGIADAEADASEISVEGEFLTPAATQTLIEQGKVTEQDLKPAKSSVSKGHRKKKAPKSEVSSSSKASTRSKGKGDAKSKAKQPSGLKMLFQGRSA